jgi:hypothetical protein
MYTVFSQICMVNKIRSIFLWIFCFKKLTPHFFIFFFFWKINCLTRVLGDTCQIVTHSQLDACNNTRVQLDTSIKYTCPIGRVYYYTRHIGHVYYYMCSILTRVFNTRVQLDACILYTCPIGRVYLIRVSNFDTCITYTLPIVDVLQFDTCLLGHVLNCTRVYSSRYCRHASKW